MSGSQYARLVSKKYRRLKLPKIDRPWRPRVIAWAGPAAFYPNRFYEIDKWYKARIDKPEKLPNLHIIDPSNYNYSLSEYLAKKAITPIDIGFKAAATAAPKKKSQEERSKLERLSRHMELRIDLDAVDTPVLEVYKHFQIFDHLFGNDTFFNNVQKLEVVFGDDEVHNGNIFTAETASKEPEVTIEHVGPAFNTLLMVNLDGNPYEVEGEMIHWLVSNIPDGQPVSNGVEVVKYLQPLPFFGTGYHRIAFVLFRHDNPISLLPGHETNSLEGRVCKISELYKKHEDVLTPSAVRFFQTSYDDTVKTTLHSMGLKSPIYEYEYNEPLKPPQKEFPEKAQPFDLYLDMYRDPKEVGAEMLEKRLAAAQLDDFEEPKWRDVNYNENKRHLPTWLHKRKMSRTGPHASIYRNPVDQP